MASNTKNGKAATQSPKLKSSSSWMILEDGTQVAVSSVKGASFSQSIRKSGKVRIGLWGVSGAGKTMTALELASGLGDRIAAIDTDNRMWQYAEMYPDVQILELRDHSPEAWMQAVYAAEAEGFDVLICDCFSDAWVGENGLLDYKAQLLNDNKQTIDGFGVWDFVNPVQRRLINALTVHSNLHVICTFRAKTEWGRETNDRGKTVIKPEGLGPVWRQGVESSFDFFGQIQIDHRLTWEKEMHFLFSGQTFERPTSEIGVVLKAWAEKGVVLPWKFEGYHFETLRRLRTENGWSDDLTRQLLSYFAIQKFAQVPGRNSYLLLRQCLSMKPEIGLTHAEECAPKLKPELESRAFEATELHKQIGEF